MKGTHYSCDGCYAQNVHPWPFKIFGWVEVVPVPFMDQPNDQSEMLTKHYCAQCWQAMKDSLRR
jgi:hypothetical protein